MADTEQHPTTGDEAESDVAPPQERQRSVRRMGRVSPADEGLSYGSYLKVPELISLQQLLSDPPAHDELLFIVIHQTYELWFRQLLFELESVRDLMFDRQPEDARHYLQRVHTIENVLVEQIAVLETMSPQDFLQFRSHLSPASGFQSVQFREVEFLSGLKQRGFLAHLGETTDERERLERRLGEPTLWDAFCDLLEANGLPMPADDDDARMRSLVTMARERERHAELWYLSEDLLTHDELFSLWRYRHILMVMRQIGSKTGTGGSSGASYLQSTLDKHFFPDLWELRSEL
ncbi:MAG TPA: tryptophan 2,3-dioxygenase family protein [Actinomycetota bacterium]|nr:tryptophan 2,3-dioxygenase family protein [Actinomycetota bacterium]